MSEDVLLGSGVNDSEDLELGVNNSTDDLFNQYGGSNDQEDSNQDGGSEKKDEVRDEAYRKARAHKVETLKNQRIRELEKQVETGKPKESNQLQEFYEDLESRGYSKEDLEIIERIAELKTGSSINKIEQTRLEKREFDSFVEAHPDLSEEQLFVLQKMNKDRGMSFNSAYKAIYPNSLGEEKINPNSHSIGSSKGSGNKQIQTKQKGGEDAVMSDFMNNYNPADT